MPAALTGPGLGTTAANSGPFPLDISLATADGGMNREATWVQQGVCGSAIELFSDEDSPVCLR